MLFDDWYAEARASEINDSNAMALATAGTDGLPSVRIGDVIRVDGIEGVVTDIKTRYTLLRDANGRESIIPNEMLLTQRVDNFSLTQSSVALQSTLTVSVDTDVAHVQAVLCQAALQVPQVLQDPPPQAFFTAFTQDGLAGASGGRVIASARSR